MGYSCGEGVRQPRRRLAYLLDRAIVLPVDTVSQDDPPVLVEQTVRFLLWPARCVVLVCFGIDNAGRAIGGQTLALRRPHRKDTRENLISVPPRFRLFDDLVAWRRDRVRDPC